MFRLFYFLSVFLLINGVYASQNSDGDEKKPEIVAQEITIYTAEGPKKIYHYGLRDVTEEKERELADKKKLNEFEKAELILQGVKNKKIKHKL